MDEKEINQKIKFTNENGVVEEADVLMFTSLPEFDKDYIIYTKNEDAGNGMSRIYSSEVVKNDDMTITLKNIETDAEWNALKNEMRKIIKEGE